MKMPQRYDAIFFMHIAKTAGTKVNDVFKSFLDSKSCIEHAEFYPDDIEGLLASYAYISGHIYYPDIERYLSDDVYVFTVMREGVSQLASHILWLDHYNNQDKGKSRMWLTKDMLELVYSIKHTNINNPIELDTLLQGMTNGGLDLLDNCQSRYFLGERGRPITDADFDNLVTCAKKFNCIISQSNLNKGLINVCQDLGMADKILGCDLDGRLNQSRSHRQIDVSNPEIRAVLITRCAVDQRFYEFLFPEA